MKEFLLKIYLTIYSIYGFIKLKLYTCFHSNIKIIVGAGKTKLKGWCSTQQIYLNIENKLHYEKYFSRKKIDYLLLEHVLEHIEPQKLEEIIQNFYEYTTQNCNIRIAVPDGFHNDANYINYVKPDGIGAGSKDHKSLFNYRNLSELFINLGFIPILREYWDEQKVFHTTYKDDDKGVISRAFINDERNKNGQTNYTSLIIDFVKKN